MPRILTAANLVLRAQQRADMESSTFVTESEWLFHLNTAFAELYSILVASGMRYYEKVQAISTLSGVSSYALPPDFLSGISVDYIVSVSTGDRRELVELMAQERNFYTQVSGSSEARAFAYQAQSLVLHPTPPAGQSYEHIYVPQPKDLLTADDNTEIDLVTPDGEAFVLWSMTVLARDKEESDITTAVAERERARARVEEWATFRALNSPRRRMVADEIGPGYYEPGDWLR